MADGVRISRAGATALGRAIAGASVETPEQRKATTALGAVLAGGAGRVYRPLELPIAGQRVKAQVRLLDHDEEQGINIELAQWVAEIAKRGITLDQLTVVGGLSVTAERVVRTLARAVRAADDPALPLGSLAEWAALDHQALGIANSAYEDLLEELDPLGVDATPTEAEVAEIRAALKKKDRVLLSTFGARKLAGYMTTFASTPAASGTPT